MIDEIKRICEVVFNSKINNTYKLECTAKYLISPNNTDELFKIINIIKENNTKYIVLGNSSNVILPKYYDGIIIKLDKFNKCIINNNELYVESGYMINKLAIELVNKSYQGLEWASGIPGTIGGCIYNNAGCYGSEIKSSLISTIVLDTLTNKIIEFNNEDCKFNYRTSIFKNNKNYIILSGKFELFNGNKEELKRLLKERTKKRISSQPLDKPSCGSVFRNPEGLVAGKLIDDLGLKGTKIGGAKVSEKHANFIINDGNATNEDIIKLIDKIKTSVKKEYNIDLILEQEIIK